MITVKCNKSCPWGIHHAWGPNFQIEKDMVLGAEFPKDTNTQDWEAFKYKLLEAGHAELIPNEKAKDSDADEGKSSENTSTSEDKTGDTDADNTDDQDAEVTPESLKAELEEIALEQMDGPMGSEKKAKAALEAIGKERYGFDADKRMNVDKIIDAIVEAAFKEE